MQLDKALRDFLAQMRSPSPEPTTSSLSDAEEPLTASDPSPPAQSRYKATTARATRASGPVRKGQAAADVRPPDHSGPRLHSTPLAATLPVKQKPVTPVGSGMDYELGSHAQAAQHTSAETVATPSRQAATRQDAAQQTVNSPERTASHKQDACVQSELAIVPNKSRQLPIVVPTEERATQTPVGHASPCPLQKAPPGRDAPWSPCYAAQEFQAHSPAQDSLRRERPGPPQGSWPERQSPLPQWAGAGIDPVTAVGQDNKASYRDALDIFASAAPSSYPSQRAPEHSHRPAQRLFGSPPPEGNSLQPAMQPPQHLPADQLPGAASRAQQQAKVDGHIPAEPALSSPPLHGGLQAADPPPAGSSHALAGVSGPSASAGAAQGAASSFVSAAAFSSSHGPGPSDQPPWAEGSPAWLSTPIGVPHTAEPTLQFRAGFRHDGPWPLNVAAVPQQHGTLPGDGYAYRQSQPFSAQQAALHASARAANRGLGAEHRAATISAPVNVMQRHPGMPGMYGLPSQVYAGVQVSQQLRAILPAALRLLRESQ
ncbi:hypothetical protein ABBQ32_005708 [Trebouxia sp. C0010 RCD-2024]